MRFTNVSLVDYFMSGTRQHYVPRFIQQGFTSHLTDRSAFTWVHRKTAEPFNTNIINAGVEGKFYTAGLDAMVDDLITDAEGQFGSLVASLRAHEPISLTNPLLPRLIAHLEIRTRHLRENFLRTGELLVSGLLDFLSDAEAFSSYMVRRIERDPSFLRESFAEELAKYGISDNDLLDQLMRVSMPIVPDFLRAQRSEFPKLAEQLRTFLPEALRKGAKSGHIRALRKSIAPDLRAQRYEPLTYRVYKVNDPPLILGDSIVLFHVQGPRRYKAWLDKDEVLNAVYLPLDTETILVGSAHSDFDVVPTDLREAIARCSLEYFIASVTSPTNEMLRLQIGTDAHILSQPEIEDLLDEIRREYE